MNVFPGTSALDKMAAFRGTLADLKTRQGQPFPFPVGLWLDNKTAAELQEPRKCDEWTAQILAAGFTAATANAFPYGAFHRLSIKTNVYLPDWSSPERALYTINVANILAKLCPKDQDASISTLPGAYAALSSPDALPQIAAQISRTAVALARIRDATGCTIRLAFEMEPDCIWESPAQFIAFYDRFLRNDPNADLIGVCYDTCHQELLPSQPGESLRLLLRNGIPITKIQLSSAIRILTPQGRTEMSSFFMDRVYLHQTREIADGKITARWDDLPAALRSRHPFRTLVCHFHIPIYLKEVTSGIVAANDELLAALDFVKKHPDDCPLLEIETYSYNVLPGFLKEKSLADSMEKESSFVMSYLKQ